MKKPYIYILPVLFALIISVMACSPSQENSKQTDVLVIGGGASGTMAAIQAARMGVQVILVEETPWLGGMLTSAGVSAIDGNYELNSGLWEEFRNRLIHHYGSAEALQTGWVSNVLFEPQVGAAILDQMVADEKNIEVLKSVQFQEIRPVQSGWETLVLGREKLKILSKLVIDGTELGDVAAKAGISYDIGMDSKNDTGESIAPEKANDIIQDLTYVAILKEYSNSDEALIRKPLNYRADLFHCTCANKCEKADGSDRLWGCDRMLEYGKLPNGYYMINWPIQGNDFYLNLIEMSRKQREKALNKAKNHTLNYVYYLQNELGYKNLGIARELFPSADGLPLIPYHRESRRIKGLVRFNVNDLARPYQQKKALYRTGIAVGDYPIDHHHDAYADSLDIPDLHFYPVPSYSIPLGALLPQEAERFIVAEKSISVTNIVNGTTRLQPVCILIGQSAGTLAALSVKQNCSPEKIRVRKVQTALLESGSWLMPYSDTDHKKFSFLALQKIGATGILRGEGKNVGWKNHTFIHPDSLLTRDALKIGLKEWISTDFLSDDQAVATVNDVMEIVMRIDKKYNADASEIRPEHLANSMAQVFSKYKVSVPEKEGSISREMFAVVLDELVDPFALRDVDHYGNFVDSPKSN